MDEEFVTPVRSLEDVEKFSNQEAQISETPRNLDSHRLPEIDNTNRNFKGQQKNEVLHCFCRKHWIVLLPHIIGFLLLAAAISFLLFVSESDIAGIMPASVYRTIAFLFMLFLTYCLHFFFMRFLNYYLQVLIITNFRIIQLDQTLFWHRNRDSIDLPEIQDIVIQQNGVLRNLLNYGELIITLSAVYSSKTLHYVPNPEYYFRKINKTKREYIMTRRVEKGMAGAQ